LFDAELTPEIQEASWVRDFLAGLSAGLMVGLSPGFRIPPPEAVPDAEETVEEDPAEGNAIVRIIRAAVLFEISAVTRPAFEEASVEEERRWRPDRHNAGLARPLGRWR